MDNGLEILLDLRFSPGDPINVLINASSFNLARFVGCVAELGIGVYFVGSGEWVLRKVLAPAIVPLSSLSVREQVQKAPADAQNPEEDAGGAADGSGPAG